jgi:hypothetical protein
LPVAESVEGADAVTFDGRSLAMGTMFGFGTPVGLLGWATLRPVAWDRSRAAHAIAITSAWSMGPWRGRWLDLGIGDGGPDATDVYKVRRAPGIANSVRIRRARSVRLQWSWGTRSTFELGACPRCEPQLLSSSGGRDSGAGSLCVSGLARRGSQGARGLAFAKYARRDATSELGVAQ